MNKHNDSLEKSLDFIPKKYRHMISNDSYHESRTEGYWIYLAEGFFCEEMQCQTIHETTQKEVLRLLRTCHEITLEDAKNANYANIVEKFETLDTANIVESLQPLGLGTLDESDAQRLSTSLNEFLNENPTYKLVNAGISSDKTVTFIFETENPFKLINEGNPTYAVLKAYYNGLGDRTTYFGLHHGNYDFSTQKRAQERAQHYKKVSFIK